MPNLKHESIGEITSYLYYYESDGGAKELFELYIGSTTNELNVNIYWGKYRNSRTSNLGDWQELSSKNRDDAIKELKESIR